VTIKVRPGIPSLRSARLVRELESSWRQIRDRNRFRIAHYSIQSNHVHLVVEAATVSDLGAGMKSVAARLTRAVNRVFARRGAVLRDRYHLHVLRSPREVRNALAYVLLNARRHAAALGDSLRRAARVDPASSGRWFDGWRSGIETAHDPPAIAQPHSWLLRVGWRRAGLIDLYEMPGR
jgi:REP element-mobilizing transposase RayT